MIGHVLILIESYKLYASGIPKTMARFSDFLEEIGLGSHYTQCYGLLQQKTQSKIGKGKRYIMSNLEETRHRLSKVPSQMGTRLIRRVAQKTLKSSSNES